MVNQRGAQNAKDDGDRFFKPSGKDESQELGFVPHFGKGDHAR
jgi:hypothetical protein